VMKTRDLHLSLQRRDATMDSLLTATYCTRAVDPAHGGATEGGTRPMAVAALPCPPGASIRLDSVPHHTRPVALFHWTGAQSLAGPYCPTGDQR
jgi:hypothetical protein